MADGLPSYGQNQVNAYYAGIEGNIGLQNAALTQIQQKNAELLSKQDIQISQLNEIEEKEKLLLTRSRMLQISQDRNSYKKKIIYTLIAIIFAIFIFTLLIYIFFKRKIAMAKK
jgi:hypothetical protein